MLTDWQSASVNTDNVQMVGGAERTEGQDMKKMTSKGLLGRLRGDAWLWAIRNSWGPSTNVA